MAVTLVSSWWGVDHLLFSLLGMLVSYYALHVETRKHRDPQYVAFCDFNQHMSCSKVLTSQYSQGFGLTRYLVGKEHFLNVPNCILGFIFYGMQLCLGLMPQYPWCVTVLWYSSVISTIGSLYLAYILFFILKDVCVVCIATYLINFSLLYLNHSII